jgi:hypothetical protein
MPKWSGLPDWGAEKNSRRRAGAKSASLGGATRLAASKAICSWGPRSKGADKGILRVFRTNHELKLQACQEKFDPAFSARLSGQLGGRQWGRAWFVLSGRAPLASIAAGQVVHRSETAGRIQHAVGIVADAAHA